MADDPADPLPFAVPAKSKNFVESFKFEKAVVVDVSDLPIAKFKGQIIESVRHHRVTYIMGTTGSGKSTQVPQYLLQEGATRIFATQPTRMATMALARRVSQELGERMGKTVGWAISGNSWRRKLTFTTAGYLLQVLVFNPEEIQKCSHIILDEVHQRTVQDDMLLLVIKLLIVKSKAKLIVMSATYNMQAICNYFQSLQPDPKPILIDHRNWPLKIMYLDDLCDATAEGVDEGVATEAERNKKTFKSSALKEDSAIRLYVQSLRSLIFLLARQFARGGCSILVFVPGIADITWLFNEALGMEHIHRDSALKFKVFALHSSLIHDSRADVFQTPKSDTCHLVFATSIAESSLTLPNVSLVIDTGIQQSYVENPNTKLAELKSSWCSVASLQQRAGRTGRTMPGTVIRMFPRSHQDQLPEYDTAELLSAPLSRTYLSAHLSSQNLCQGLNASALLQLLLQPPDPEAVETVKEELVICGALESVADDALVTSLGRLMLQIPFGKEVCQLLWVGASIGCAADAVILASALLVADPFTTPSMLVLKDTAQFCQQLRESSIARYAFDGGRYSEPIMLRNLYVEWWHWQRDKGLSKWQCMQIFTKQFSVDANRMYVFDSQVKMITEYFLPLCTGQSKAVQQLMCLSGERPSETNIFTESIELLRCMLTCVMSCHILTSSFGDLQEIHERVVRKSGMNRQRTVMCKVSGVSKSELETVGKKMGAAMAPVPFDRVVCRGQNVYIELCPESLPSVEVQHSSPTHSPIIRDSSISTAIVRQMMYGCKRYSFFPSTPEKVATLSLGWSPGFLQWTLLTSHGPQRTIIYFRNPLGVVCNTQLQALPLACCLSTIVTTSARVTAIATTLVPQACLHYLLLGLNPPKVPISVAEALDGTKDIKVISFLHQHFFVHLPASLMLQIRCIRRMMYAAIRDPVPPSLDYHPALATAMRVVSEARPCSFMDACKSQRPLEEYLESLDEEREPEVPSFEGPSYFEGASPRIRDLVVQLIILMGDEAHTMQEVNELVNAQATPAIKDPWGDVPDRFEFGIGINGLIRIAFFRKFPRLFELEDSHGLAHVTIRVSDFGKLIPQFHPPPKAEPAVSIDQASADDEAWMDGIPRYIWEKNVKEADISDLLRIPPQLRALLSIVLPQLDEEPMSLERLNNTLQAAPEFQALPAWDNIGLCQMYGLTDKGVLQPKFFDSFEEMFHRSSGPSGPLISLSQYGQEILMLIRRLTSDDATTKRKLTKRPLIQDTPMARRLLDEAVLSDEQWLKQLPTEVQNLLQAMTQAMTNGPKTIKQINEELSQSGDLCIEASDVDLATYGVGAKGALLVKFFRRMPRVFRCGEARAHGTMVTLTDFGHTIAASADNRLSMEGDVMVETEGTLSDVSARAEPNLATVDADFAQTENELQSTPTTVTTVTSYSEKWFLSRMKARETVKERSRDVKRGRQNQTQSSVTRLQATSEGVSTDVSRHQFVASTMPSCHCKCHWKQHQMMPEPMVPTTMANHISLGSSCAVS